jgi:hypothetical protein
MSTSRIKDKVSELVKNQLPEFIRTDYTTFVAFLQYYYKFLEQDQGALELVQNARKYSDIDQTADSFVNYFLTNYAKDLPYDLQVNKPLLIKRIKDLYAAKGSSLFIETLFKVLYDTAALTRHPYDFVLRPSDGKWNLRTSIRVYKTFGSTTDIKDRFLTLTKNNISYTVEVLRVKDLTSNLYEIFYRSRFEVPFTIDDTVTVSNEDTVLFIGTVKPTTTGWRIVSGGTGFVAGQIFNVAVSGAVDTLVRISKVSSTGAIESLKILNYGYNYTDDFLITLTNALGVTAYSKNLETTTGGFREDFRMIRYLDITSPTRYFDTDYADITYTGDLLAETTTASSQEVTSVTISTNETSADATISFTVGAVARYPGEYTSTQGFASEPDVKLQDGDLYQPFAYQIESELDISVFYDIVKKLVHQAGTNLFVNRVISTTANLSGNVSVISRKNVYSELNSVFSTLETNIKLVNKPFDDSVGTAEVNTYVLTKYPISDDAPILDNITINVFKTLADDALSSDDTSFSLNKEETHTVGVTDESPGDLQDYTNTNNASRYFLEQYTANAASGTAITIS